MYGVANETGTEAPRRWGYPVDVGRLLQALGRQKWWLIGLTLLGAGAGMYVARHHVPTTYQARAVMLWEPEGEAESRQLYTRIDSIKLPSTLEVVRERVDGPKLPDELAEAIKVDYEPDSNVVSITTSAHNPKTASAVSNATVRVFLDRQRQLVRTRNEERVATLRKDLERARAQLEKARSEYSQFREKHGIAHLDAQRKQAIEETADLRAKARMAQAELSPTLTGGDGQAALSRRLERQVPQLAETRRKLQAARARFSNNHPRVQSLAAELRALEQEAAKATAGPETAASRRLAERRRSRLEDLLAESRKRLARLSRIDSKASGLLANVQVNQERVQGLQQKMAQARDALEESSTQFRVLARAQPPEHPVESYRPYVAAAFPPAILMLSVLFVLGWELRGLRVVTPKEAGYWGRSAVIGATTWPRRRTLNELMEELVEFVPKATGETLVVGADRRHTGLADDIASRLRLLLEFEDSWPVQYDDDFRPSSVASIAGSAASGSPRAGNGEAHGTSSVPETGVADEWAFANGPGGAPGVSGGEDLDAYRGTYAGVDPFASTGTPDAGGESGIPVGAHGGMDVVLWRHAPLSLPPERRVSCWYGPDSGPSLRRAARRADRVLVIVRARQLSCMQMHRMRARIGRDDEGLAFLITDLPPWLGPFEDRIGPVGEFWRTRQT